MTKDEALKLAIETLESSRVFVMSREVIKRPEGADWYDSRITAFKEALAQPVQPEQDFKTATKEDAPLVKWAKDQTPPLPLQPEQEPNNTRPCRSCGGTGDQDTGIAESPIATCKPCKGTGQIALAQPEKRNFCPRCGKRTAIADLVTIHTCTPPRGNA